MLEKNQIHTIEITGAGEKGEGVGRIGGMTVFVPQALPGERAEILIVKVLKHYAFGKLLKLIDASPDRTVPACPRGGPMRRMRLPALLLCAGAAPENTARKGLPVPYWRAGRPGAANSGGRQGALPQQGAVPRYAAGHRLLRRAQPPRCSNVFLHAAA